MQQIVTNFNQISLMFLKLFQSRFQQSSLPNLPASDKQHINISALHITWILITSYKNYVIILFIHWI